MTLYFEHNPDYYRGADTCIDWLTVKRFTRPANAVKAIEDGTIDLLYLYIHALQPLYQFPTTVPCQQWPFFQDNYYVLFLNRHHGPLSDERNCRLLKEAIDYRAINLYLRMRQIDEEGERPQSPRLSFDLQIACANGVFRYLAQLIGRSTGTSTVNSISITREIREEADAFLTNIFFGVGYSRLSQFFHSDGIYNFFGYADPQVDDMLSQLNQTGNLATRRRIGQHVLSILQEDFAIISLAPHFQYTFSPLEIQFDDNLTSLLDLLQNMSQVIVERHQSG
jgi:ABC-type transport system substrate-binding protein